MPGASSVGSFWSLLTEGRCAVRDRPDGRWQTGRFLHPRPSEPGFSYSFAGGYLDDPFLFDAAAFGISPREAAQMDPQQRVLLEVVWEALEDAGIPPSRLAGENVGVYVGASNTDYASGGLFDPAAIESHFMTGNSLSVVSNRISHAFDWHGPSFTTDSACSSSLVALAQALAAIESGAIDMAVVAGVNLLLSPAPFVGFSRASMLSPTGLCRPFSAAGDGYVRAEGAIAIVLERARGRQMVAGRIHAMLLGAGVNSDGRTDGISFPSAASQQALIEQTLRQARLTADSLAFVEAHGTGTRVGDPVEALAIGQALGQRRSRPLPVGSVKSNIGHLEPASGLAGLLKAILAIEHRTLPRSLHLESMHPEIPFAELGLAPVAEPVVFAPSDGVLHAGVCNYGFGGTNAHVILRGCEPGELTVDGRGLVPAGLAKKPELMMISAHSREALAELARDYAELIEGGQYEPAAIASAVAWERERLPWRLAVAVGEPDKMASAVRAAVVRDEGGERTAVVGAAAQSPPKIGFVYSGNGCQWMGMGRVAYARNHAFRDRFQKVNAIFKPIAGWSLVEALHDNALGERLASSAVAQPLIFALQSALGFALCDLGANPAVVVGHSVGEVAAAEASGALALDQAVRLIHQRSKHQEAVRGMGRMAALKTGEEAARDILAEVKNSAVEIAAINGPSSVTVTGDAESVRRVCEAARRRRIAAMMLDIDYPFHSSFLDAVREATLSSLEFLRPVATGPAFISSVSGEIEAGERLGAAYWWNNLRQPVQFQKAVETARRASVDLFIELGARPIFVATIAEILRGGGLGGEVVASLSDADTVEADPVLTTACRALVRGATLAEDRLFGTRGRGNVALPHYRWQRQRYVLPQTSETLGIFAGFSSETAPHPLIGSRPIDGAHEWRTLLDAATTPYLADHRVDGEILMPAAGMIEMALAAAREALGPGPIGLRDFDIVGPMIFGPEEMREVAVSLSLASRQIDIRSRPRFSAGEWISHARGAVVIETADPEVPPWKLRRALTRLAHAGEVYAAALEAGVDYGANFRGVRTVAYDGTTSEIEIRLPAADASAARYILHPVVLDAALQGLFVSTSQASGETKAYLPVRARAVKVWRDNAAVVRAAVFLEGETRQSKTISLALFDRSGAVVASAERILMRAVVLSRAESRERRVLRVTHDRRPAGGPVRPVLRAAREAIKSVPQLSAPEAGLLVRAFATSLAHRVVFAASDDGVLSVPAKVASGRIAERSRPLLHALLDLLQAKELVGKGDRGWIVQPISGLPEPEVILRTMANRNPEANVEIRLAARALHSLETALRDGPGEDLDVDLLEQLAGGGAAGGVGAVRAALERLAEVFRPEAPRILIAEPWAAAVVAEAARFSREHSVEIALAGVDRDRFEAVKARYERGSFRFVDLRAAGGQADRDFDLLLGAAFSPLFGGDPAFARAAIDLMARSSAVLIIQPTTERALDVLFGASHTWFSAAVRPAARLIPKLAVSRSLLADAGVDAIEVSGGKDGLARVLTGRPSASREAMSAAGQAAGAARVVAVGLLDADRSLVDAMAAEIGEAGIYRTAELSLEVLDPAGAADKSAPPVEVIDLPGVHDGDGDFGELEARIARLQRHVACLAGNALPARLWIVVRRDAKSGRHSADPVADAILAFGRTLLNEYPSLQVRLVSLVRPLAAATAGRRLACLLANPGPEREIALSAHSTAYPRVVSGRRAAAAIAPDGESRTTLTFGRRGSFDECRWEIARRPTLAKKEVEVEVAATGVNFRDVMVALGLLDEDILGDGLTEASLGLECSGVVSRVGDGVESLRPGDRVMGFAADAFSSFVTAPADCFFPVPRTVSMEAAATIPVAFATAWYSLVQRAQLRERELVLVHGAGGGVGLAALQIARRRGARVIATAGTVDKRDLAVTLGAERAYDSRSLRFADEIRRDFGGVDVVLNSLSGEAMAKSLDLLKPAGRFIELGKRDYMENTQIRLRPFTRNLSYFGVDLDQLLRGRRSQVKRAMAALADCFERGELSPLPYRVFEGHDAGSAFRLMQAAGHVGKILVRPASRGVVVESQSAFRPGAGVHLVIGGTSGLGFETASWLAERGARRVMVASRRGALTDELAARVQAIRRSGTAFAVETVDVTDAKSVRALIRRVTALHGPIVGVIHAAMVLDDGLVADLTAERLKAVLAPKVRGVVALDAAVRGQPLDYFAVYSSAAVLIGNPGQGAYVAANGFLEGFIRRRRAAGLPGLAIGWGAIADSGVVARDGRLAQQLLRKTGLQGIPVRDALAHLGWLIAHQAEADPVEYFGEVRRTAAAGRLPILQTPAFSGLFESMGGEESLGEAGNLADAIAEKTAGEAQALVLAVVREEIAKILRLPAEAVEIDLPLADVGLDSLMALELRLEMERRWGVDVPVMGLKGGKTLTSLAEGIVRSLRPREDAGGGPANGHPAVVGLDERALIAMHSGDAVDVDDMIDVVAITQPERRFDGGRR